MKFLLPLASLCFLSACAGSGAYPSLNPRPIEAKTGALLAEPAPLAAGLAPSSPEMQRQIAAARDAARANGAVFDIAWAKAQPLVAKAGSAASESWIAAHMEVSAVERARGPVKAARADLDTLLRTLLSGPAGEDLAAARAAIQEVEAEDTREENAVRALQAALTP